MHHPRKYLVRKSTTAMGYGMIPPAPDGPETQFKKYHIQIIYNSHVQRDNKDITNKYVKHTTTIYMAAHWLWR